MTKEEFKEFIQDSDLYVSDVELSDQFGLGGFELEWWRLGTGSPHPRLMKMVVEWVLSKKQNPQ